MDICKHLANKYLPRMDRDIPTSADRVKLFEDMQNDPVLIDYLSSSYYKSKHIKNKVSGLAESEPFSHLLESIATYILYPDFKEHNIRSKEQLRDRGRFKCKKTGKYKKFDRKVYLEAIANKINEKSDYDDYMTADELAAKIVDLPENTKLWDVFDFAKKSHIKKLLHAYNLIVSEIEGKPDTRAWSIIVVLNELINKSKFSPVDREIILLLQKGNYSYGKIRKLINKKFKVNYNYDAIYKKISLLIPNKIAKTYRESVKNLKNNEKE